LSKFERGRETLKGTQDNLFVETRPRKKGREMDRPALLRREGKGRVFTKGNFRKRKTKKGP